MDKICCGRSVDITFEVSLADNFGLCVGSSSVPELLFKRLHKAKQHVMGTKYSVLTDSIYDLKTFQ